MLINSMFYDEQFQKLKKGGFSGEIGKHFVYPSLLSAKRGNKAEPNLKQQRN
jgi:hypothetical protein